MSAVMERVNRAAKGCGWRSPQRFTTSGQMGISNEVWSDVGIGTRFGAISTTSKRASEYLNLVIYGSDSDAPVASAKPFHSERDFVPTRPLSIRDAITDIRWIRDSLGLSMTDVAGLFGVTRKAVYDWFDGSKPRSQIAERISAVRSLAEDDCPPEFCGILNQFWSSPVEQGPALIDILKSAEPPSVMLFNAKLALKAIIPKISETVARNNAKPTRNAVGQAHNDDLFRSL